jgi:hypothetical protein
MPRLKSFSAMLDTERNKTLDDFFARFTRLERLVQGGQVTTKPAAPKAKASAAPKKVAAKTSAKKTAKKVVAAPKKVAQAAKKPGPKPKVVASKKTTAVKAKAASTGKKPPRLIDAIQTVIGSATMNAIQVHGELKKRHWLPNSDDPLGYIRYTLSKEKDIFHRIEGQRGFYHLGKGKAANGGAKAKPAPKAAPAAAKSAPAVAAAPPPAPESKTQVVAPEPPKVVAAAPPPPPPAPVQSKPAGEDEDPSAVADEILKGAGIDTTGIGLPGQ